MKTYAVEGHEITVDQLDRIAADIQAFRAGSVDLHGTITVADTEAAMKFFFGDDWPEKTPAQADILRREARR